MRLGFQSWLWGLISQDMICMGVIRKHYDALVGKGKLVRDPAQIALTACYDDLLQKIEAGRRFSRSGVFGWLFGKGRRNRAGLRGLYVHGDVGRGKTMLMDLFFSCLPEGDRRRAHFNDFMNDVHERIKAHRVALERGETRQDNTFPAVAAALSEEAHILCFDEFAVTDIADAMILSRLFTALFKEGVILLATSNVAPDDLYRDGLNRQLFLPFITTLKEHVKVVNLDASTDYRLAKAGCEAVYMTPLGTRADKGMNAAWARVTGGARGEETRLAVRGRAINVPCAAGSAARFEFADLCSRPLSALDYMALVARYRTFFIDHVPVLDDSRRNEAKRFILLIDTLYDHHARLFISAAATPEALYEGHMKTAETFEFERAASRLFEMQSEDYLHGWAHADPRRQ